MQMLQLLWLLPHSRAVPEGKPLAPLCVRPEGSDDDNRLRGEGCCSRMGSHPRIAHAPSVCYPHFRPRRESSDLRDLCKFPAWGNDRAGVGTK